MPAHQPVVRRRIRPLRGLLTVGTVLVTLLIGALGPALAATFSTTPMASWIPNNTVYAMAQSGDVVYLGGSFTALKSPTGKPTVTRNHLAAVDASTGQLLAWDPNVNGTVRSLAVGPDGTVYAGGDFTTVAGATANRLEALTPTGAPVPGWSASAPNTVRDLLVVGGSLYAGGSFGNMSGSPRNAVAKLSLATGAVDKAFNAHVAGGKVRALASSPDGSTLLLGGLFTTLSGQSRPFLGSVRASTGAVTSWAPQPLCTSCNILDIAVADGSAWAAAAGSGGRVSSWPLTSDVHGWVRHGDGDVQSVAVYDGVVYAGGHFGPDFSGYARHQLAAMNESTGAVLDYALSLTGNDHPGIWSMLVDPGRGVLRLGGGLRFAAFPEARYAAMPLG